MRPRSVRLLRVLSRRGLVTALCAGIFLVAGPVWSPADSLSDLPSDWQDRIDPVPESDISGAEPLVQQAIREAREAIAGLLADPSADPVALAGAYGQLGAIYQLQEVEGDAERCFSNARRLQPDAFRWAYYAGYLALRSGQTDKALGALQAARELNPQYAAIDLRLGEVWLERGDFTRARPLFEQAAREPGLRAAALYYLGQLDTLERRYEAAVEHLEEALRLNPDATEVHYPLAQAYRALGRDALAREHLARFQQRLPAAEDPLLSQLKGAVKRSVPLFRKGMESIYARHYAAAADQFAQGLAIDPGNAPARVSYARALFLSDDTAGARRELGKALSAQPTLALGRFLVGVLDESAGEKEAAAEGYVETLKLDPAHAGAHYALGNLRFRAGRFDDAAGHYAAALDLDRDVAPARLLRLVALRQAGESDAALGAALRGLLQDNPQDPSLQYAQVRLLALSSDPSVRDPTQALDLASRLVLQQPIPPYLAALALSYAAADRFAEAVQTQQQLLAFVAWMAPPSEVERLQADLVRYQDEKLPQTVWSPEDPMLQPPPFDAKALFRDYPAAVPF